MSQQAAVTLNTVVYDPAGANKGILKWVNRVGGLLNSFSHLTQGFLTNSGAAKRTKVSFRLDIPVVATVDSSCSCAGSVLRTSSFQIEYWIDPNATAAERTDLRLRAKDLAASALVTSAVDNLDPAYA